MASLERNQEEPPREVVDFCKSALSDMTLVVGNKEFKVHKMLLALRCDYFQVLFFRDFKEKQLDEIELDANPVAFQRMLTYIYDGNFGDEDFLKCPSKLKEPSKSCGIENYRLYEVLDRFDVRNSKKYFWDLSNNAECNTKK